MNSSDASDSDPNKKNSVPGVSSRLLKGTSASLAKSGVTPTLTRKFGSPKTQKTPTIGPRYICGFEININSCSIYFSHYTHYVLRATL
jgi:hypothetical protein